MVTPPLPQLNGAERVRGPLADSLVALAGLPDVDPRVDPQLVLIARLAADLVSAVSYASVTAVRGEAPTTVAASSELALEVDEAQYADGAGPCLDALGNGAPVLVPDVSATMSWPRFRDTAYRIGLRASASVPLFAGRGDPVAVLNLYGRDADAMGDLSARIVAVYDPLETNAGDRGGTRLDAGSAELISGLLAAFAIRDRIQQAIGVLMHEDRCTPDAAYDSLRARAERAGRSLPSVAVEAIRRSSR